MKFSPLFSVKSALCKVSFSFPSSLFWEAALFPFLCTLSSLQVTLLLSSTKNSSRKMVRHQKIITLQQKKLTKNNSNNHLHKFFYPYIDVKISKSLYLLTWLRSFNGFNFSQESNFSKTKSQLLRSLITKVSLSFFIFSLFSTCYLT